MNETITFILFLFVFFSLFLWFFFCVFFSVLSFVCSKNYKKKICFLVVTNQNHYYTVAKRSWCQYFVFDVSLANGNMVFSRFELFFIGYWSKWWASFWKSLWKMVDRFNELGFSCVFDASMAWCNDCYTRINDWSRWYWYVFIFSFIYLSS